jgi:hypothetical protein
MENTLAEIICIIDKSGSMQALKDETVNGLNTFIENQKSEESPCNFTLVQFNQELEVSIMRRPICEVAKLHSENYKPFGYTALYDALGITLKKAIETIFLLPADLKPNKVMVFIITDGLENASRFYNKSVVQDLIRKLVNNNQWEFEFYGANINSFAEAENLGLTRDKATNWNFNKQGIDTMVGDMSKKAAAFRKK